MKTKLISGLGVTLLGVILAATFLRVHYIGYGSDADLVWNSNQAYILIDIGRFGWRLNYLQYLVALTKGWFHVAAPPDDRNCYGTLLRVTKEEVQSYDLGGQCLTNAVGVGEDVYATETGVLLKWTGNRFERTSSNELEAVKSNKPPISPDFDNYRGWSKRHDILTRLDDEIKFGLELDGQQLMLNVSRTSANREISVSLVRPHQTPERIWHLEQQSRKVSAAEYERIFGKR